MPATGERSLQALLFDLDGTLVDSRVDLATAINRMRAERDLKPLPREKILPHIGWGARNLVARCLAPEGSPVPSPEPDPEAPTDEEAGAALRVFRRHYDDCLLDTTQPYPGIPELLEEGRRRGHPMAVVTNKPERFSRKILAGLGMADPFRWVIGGDTLERRKPDPLPLQEAGRRMGRSAEEVVLIGDGLADFEAARAAGCSIIMVAWGLTPPATLHAKAPGQTVDSVKELHQRIWPADAGAAD
ncbi:MAG: HAD-IA family hydrolase [Candidatus Eisenbacteria bacterium]|nr:HAD-IA family hydrolase [Candidatus Eisenbacteria bacterium]